MSNDFCPICFSELEVVDVAPCFDCGNTKEEILHFKEGKHTYGLFRIFNKDIVLCNFCMVDFSSYDASFFGLKKNIRIGLGTRSFAEVRSIRNPEMTKDKFCPECKRRLKFLNWLVQVRGNNQKQI